MSLNNLITNEMLLNAIRQIPDYEFDTFDVVDVLEKSQPLIIDKIRKKSPGQYKSIVGKALIRFSSETRFITRVLRGKYSPLKWHK